MASGKYRNRITIERVTREQNEYGESVESWSTLMTLQAAVIPVSAKETIENQQQKEQITHTIYVRYSSDIADLNTDDRVLFGTKILNLSSVINVGGRNREYQCTAIEVVN
ncbi:phage head closure protein [Rubinisphaera italica]|uniref:Phage head-tail joining protein n=1 Tax=Rubinisphaera italica TaxID=2527969 RepID=A0A5C5XR93_9PLAN|nr:phage head closure protein [Rubinisphaera italica]TWT64242.1 Phage head-tail joining protein [Rubinisphaera italica]